MVCLVKRGWSSITFLPVPSNVARQDLLEYRAQEKAVAAVGSVCPGFEGRESVDYLDHRRGPLPAVR